MGIVVALFGTTEKYKNTFGLVGVALIIQSAPISTPWLTTPSQSEMVLDHVYEDTLRTAVIGIPLLQDGAMPQLTKYYSTLPLAYKMCGEAIYPYQSQRIQLWRPE